MTMEYGPSLSLILGCIILEVLVHSAFVVAQDKEIAVVPPLRLLGTFALCFRPKKKRYKML